MVLGFGINGIIQVYLPQQKPQKVNFILDLKARYIHSLWYNEKNINIKSYKLEYVQIITSIGIALKKKKRSKEKE